MHIHKTRTIFLWLRNMVPMAGLLLLAFSWTAAAQSDDSNLRLQLLSGKTGRPVANQHIVLMGKGGHVLDPKGETTDGEGYAPIPNLQGGEIEIAVDVHKPCSKAMMHTFDLVKVRTAGVVSENTCRARISMYPQPGTLIFFVRDETLLEKMRH